MRRWCGTGNTWKSLSVRTRPGELSLVSSTRTRDEPVNDGTEDPLAPSEGRIASTRANRAVGDAATGARLAAARRALIAGQSAAVRAAWSIVFAQRRAASPCGRQIRVVRRRGVTVLAIAVPSCRLPTIIVTRQSRTRTSLSARGSRTLPCL